MKRLFYLWLAFIPLLAFSTNYQVGTLDELMLKEQSIRPGDSVFLKPGSYNGGIVLGKSHASEVVFYFRGSLSSDDRYTIDLKGKNITVILDGVTLTGGKQAGIGIRGDYIKVIGKNNALITDNNFGMSIVGTNHLVQGLTFKGQTSTGITGNNKRLNPDTREVGQEFHWYQPDNNWRITQCSFFDIHPPVPGDAGGALRIIPYAEDVIIDNNYFENIGGSCVWFDHDRDGIEIYYNTFKNIPNETGKCIFIEICDPRPNSNTPFVAKIAGNQFINVAKQTILIAASSGVTPRGIEVWGNTVYDGWGLIAGAMERRFARRYDKDNRNTWEWVDARLENIIFHHNVIRPTTGRNHGAFYSGPLSGKIEWDNNYYVTGHQYSWEKPNGLIDEGTITEGKIYEGGDKMNVHGVPIHPVSYYDKHAVTGPMPDSFPWPEVFSGIPVPNYARGEIDNPDPPDSTITNPPDSTIIPPVNTDKPDVWIISDLSSGRTDPDDRVSAAMVLAALDKVDLKGFTIGAHKWDLRGVLQDWFNPNLGNAYAQEVGALNAEYGGFPTVLPMYEAITTGKAFKEGSLNELTGSLKAMYEAAQEVTSQGKTLYVLLWGPQNEAAYFADYARRQTDQRVFLNTVFISHASSPDNLNNCARDAEACAFLHNLAAQGKIKYYELGFAGKVIDDKTFPKIGTEVLKSKIGHYLQEKWQNEKPDGSDAITFFVAFVDEVGGGLDYLATLKSDGSSNEAKLMNDFSKPPIYDFLQERYAVAVSGQTGGGSGPPDPPNSDEYLIKAEAYIQELKDTLNALEQLIDKMKK